MNLFEEKQQMHYYDISVKRKGDEHPTYHLTELADNEEDASAKAIEFLVMNAWWPSVMTLDERRKHLTIHKVEMRK